MRWAALILLGLIPMSVPVSSGHAQQFSGPPHPRFARGLSVDQFIYDEAGLTAVSFRLSALRPSSLNTEIGISLFPSALQARALLLAPDFGAAYHLPLATLGDTATGNTATLLIKAGGSALTGLGHDFLFAPGVHLGGGLIVRIDDRTGVRIDVIRHYYQIDGHTEPIWSIGLGITALPRHRPPAS
jgi:hypothetical protein